MPSRVATAESPLVRNSRSFVRCRSAMPRLPMRLVVGVEPGQILIRCDKRFAKIFRLNVTIAKESIEPCAMHLYRRRTKLHDSRGTRHVLWHGGTSKAVGSVKPIPIRGLGSAKRISERERLTWHNNIRLSHAIPSVS